MNRCWYASCGLINNANKYSLPDTTVTVIVDCLPKEVMVSVLDQG